MKKYIIGGIIVVLIGGGGVSGWYLFNQDIPTVMVATFNLEKLGKNNSYQTRNAATIISQFDLVAVQEVMNYGEGEDGKQAIQDIVATLDGNWTSIISSEANGTASAAASSDNPPSFEFYAYIWRTDKIALIPGSDYLWDEVGNPDPDLGDQERQFDREPFIASFKTVEGNLDFTMITIHAAAPANSWRDEEIQRLKVVYETVQSSDPHQNDVFLYGDFNTSVDKTEWDSLKSIDSIAHILTASDKTTINKSTGNLSQNQYDTFWYQTRFTSEDIVPNSGQVIAAWNATLSYDPDNTPSDSITDEDARKRWTYSRVVSDHLPVMVALYVNKDTDGFK